MIIDCYVGMIENLIEGSNIALYMLIGSQCYHGIILNPVQE